MPPPCRRPVQAEQARGLRRDAVGRDELLLLADGVEEAERVHAESDDTDGRDR
jgi:hypothetical protein